MRYELVCEICGLACVRHRARTQARPRFCSNACAAAARTSHGHERGGKSLEYSSWDSMIQRCLNPRSSNYPRYGGRGITVCERWRSFARFLADMGPRPSAGHSLDRLDNNGNYEPGNCRWATRKEQQRNRRGARVLTVNGVTKTLVEWSEITGIALAVLYGRANQHEDPTLVLRTTKRHRSFLTHNGRTLSLTEWAEETGLSRGLLSVRLGEGWSVERALTTPKRAQKDDAT